MASVYKKDHLLAPQAGDSTNDEVAQMAATFAGGAAANSTPLPTAKVADAANMPQGKKAEAAIPE